VKPFKGRDLSSRDLYGDWVGYGRDIEEHQSKGFVGGVGPSSVKTKKG